jgi:hypothetical protein
MTDRETKMDRKMEAPFAGNLRDLEIAFVHG